jgi:hypothetical protein
MFKTPPMAVGLEVSGPTLELSALKRLLQATLPPVVFCDAPITKMHDSLPMLLFRFETLIKLSEHGQLAWLAYLFPWVLINEAISHTSASTVERLGWFRLAYSYLMTCLVTYFDCSLGPRMRYVRRMSASESVGRTLFDRRQVMHPRNAIAGIVFEIHHACTPISLQRISTVPLEMLFGLTRLHTKTHQTVSAIIKTMEIDQAMRLVSASQEGRNRRLASARRLTLARRDIIWDRNQSILRGRCCGLWTFPYPAASDRTRKMRTIRLWSICSQICFCPLPKRS